MNQLSRVFQYQGSQIRTVVKDGELWFVANDVCRVLEVGNVSAAVGRLDPDEKGLISIDTLGGPQSMICVNEQGLYELILGSRKKEAKEFKRWIKRDVLPSIRQHGAYLTPETIEKTLSDPDFIIELATKLKQANEDKVRLQSKIELDKPKVVFAESLQVSNDTINVNDLAKLLRQNGVDIGEVRLFRWLRENGYLIKSGTEYNMTTQRSMDMGLFEIKMGTRQSSSGFPKLTRTPKVTGKGQIYFINKFVGREAANG